MASESHPDESDAESRQQCSPCHDGLDAPHTMTCHHSVFRGCINKAASTTADHDHADATKLVCPACSTENPPSVSDVNTNHLSGVSLPESPDGQSSNDNAPQCTHHPETVPDVNTNHQGEVSLPESPDGQSSNDNAPQCTHHSETVPDVNTNHQGEVSLPKGGDGQSSTDIAPRCTQHPERTLDLCCVTCDRLLSCVPCMRNAHEGHDLQDAVALSESERKRLQFKLGSLEPFREQLCKMREQIGNAQERLGSLVQRKAEELKAELEREVEMVKVDTKDMNENMAKREDEMDDVIRSGISTKKLKIEKEMTQASLKYNSLRQKYIEVCEEEKREAEKELCRLREQNEREKSNLLEKLSALNKGTVDLTASIKRQEDEISKKLEALSEELDAIAAKVDEVDASSATLLQSNCTWSNLKTVPNLCLLIDVVIAEIKGKVPDVDNVTALTVRGLSAAIPSRPAWFNISQEPEHVTDIGGAAKRNWRITGITCSPEGNVVISGEVSLYYSYLSEIDINGHCLREERLETSSRLAWRYCDHLAGQKYVTVCKPSEMGVYNAKTGKYKKTNIGDITGGRWPPERVVSCVATDRDKKHIFVCGKDARDVFVFDKHLKFVRILALPDDVRSPFDVTIHKGSPIVCDAETGRAFVSEIEGVHCRVRRELVKPDMKQGDWRPYSVCVDRGGLIYLLWGTEGSPEAKRVLVQYSQDGRHLIKTRIVDKDSWCVTTTRRDTCEKILIVTYNTRKLIIYGLGAR